MFQSAASDATITLLIKDANRQRINAIREMVFPTAGVIAPMLVGLIYPWLGIGGVIAIDFLTFLIAIAVLSNLYIPKLIMNNCVEEQTNSWKTDLKKGYLFLIDHKSLLGLILYFSFTNFMLNGPLELVIPYILQITGSEVIVSMMLSIMSVGTFCGGLIIAIWSRVNLRMYIVLGAMTVNGLMMIVFGVMRTPLALGIVLFFLMMPLPIVNALFKSILQIKIPIDMQGRVFSIAYQIAYGSAPLSFLLVGPLVDTILEPQMQSGTWPVLINIFGELPGAGIGLVLSSTGGLIVVITIVSGLFPSFRELESRLPSYKFDDD